MTKKMLSNKLSSILYAKPTDQGDIEAALWPHVMRASITKELPNWWEIGIEPEEATRAGEGIAQMTLEALVAGTEVSRLEAGDMAVEILADPKARPGRPRVHCELLAEPELRLRLAIAQASGSAVAFAGGHMPSIEVECSWSGAKVAVCPGSTVGRAPIRDIILSEDAVSRLHGVFRADGDGIVFEDASTNGTTLNGEPIEGRSRALVTGDTLVFANSQCALAIL